MANNSIDLYALGQSIDSTWGRSSTPKTASYSVKVSMRGMRLFVSYCAIVNFGTERQMIDMKRAYAGESDTVIAATMKRIKDSYKELSGRILRVEPFGDEDEVSVEIIGFDCHNARRTAYFRRNRTFEIGS